MKSLLLAVASLAVVAAPLAASAQSFGHGRDGGASVRGSQQQYQSAYGRGGDRQGFGRGFVQAGRGDDRRGDYRRYDDRDNGGDAVLAGIAGLILGSALSGHADVYSPPYGYAQPYAYAPAYSPW